MAADKFRGRRILLYQVGAFALRRQGFWVPARGVRLGKSTVSLALETCRQNIVNGLAFFQKFLEFNQFGDSIYEQLNEFSL